MKIPVKEYITFITKYIKNQKVSVLFLSLALLANVGMKILHPQVLRHFIDSAKEGAVTQKLVMIALMFIGIVFLQQLFNLVSNYLGQKVAWRATNDLRIDLIEHCINLDMTFHKKHKSGELIERVDGDVSQLFGLFSDIMLNIINNFILLVGILLVLLCENWLVSLSLGLFSVFAISILWYVKSKTLSYWVKASEMNAEFYGFLGEQISSRVDIASCGAKNYVMRKFYYLIRQIFPIINRANLTWASMWSATLIIFAVGNGISLLVSAYLWSQGRITIGTVYLIFNYAELLRRPIEEIRVNLQRLQVSGASILRVVELFEHKSKIAYTSKKITLSKPTAVEFQNVSFSYEEDVPVLRDISLKLQPGEKLGVIGHTGSGKTTLARLLTRLYDIQFGKILLDNNNISDIPVDEFKNNVAYVTQNVQLFSGTLRENITLYKDDIDDKIILHVINELQLDEWFSKFSDGLDSIIEVGGSLSAGEAQLLAFIRVFLKDPGLIILDEATSRIDPITEKLIEKSLDNLLKNRTSLLIAHRLSTLSRVDKILIIDKGVIEEYGMMKELLSDFKSKYYNLVKV